MYKKKKPFSKKSLKIHIYGEGIENYIHLDNNCTVCKTCAKVCPVDTIIVNEEKKNITLKGKCFGYFACLHQCPYKAIHIKGEISKDRYRNKNITLAEIIESNK